MTKTGLELKKQKYELQYEEHTKHTAFHARFYSSSYYNIVDVHSLQQFTVTEIHMNVFVFSERRHVTRYLHGCFVMQKHKSKQQHNGFRTVSSLVLHTIQCNVDYPIADYPVCVYLLMTNDEDGK
jgi:translation elongation factor EF-Tu-like GTPase